MTPVVAAERKVDVRQIYLNVDSTRLSALISSPALAKPRGTVLALHGAGMSAQYFDVAAHPDTSLLKLAPQLGFRAVAIDRPGYGSSAARWPNGVPLHAQEELILTALNDLRNRYDDCGEVMLLAHSYGGQVALAMASRAAQDFVGVDLTGCGRRYKAGLYRSSSPWSSSWGPLSLYPPNTFNLLRGVAGRTPFHELAEIAIWPQRFQEIAETINVPIRLTFAEYEPWWRHDEWELSELRKCFGRSASVSIDRQAVAGHNVSIGWSARAYHLRALAFFHDCLLGAPDNSGAFCDEML